jgi:two-component system, NarL family, response regulator LiaR
VNPGPAIRVMIVHDYTLIREGITSVLAAYDDLAVVGAAGSADEALDTVGDLGADVLIVDLALPEVDGVTATSLLRQRYQDVQIVVLTDQVDETAIRGAIQAGANACLLKTVGADELAEAIRGVTRGRSTFSSELLPQLLDEPGDDRPGMGLTPRERDILPLLASGLTNKGIAQELGLTHGTVRIYVSGILAKLGAANRTEATAVAIREGLVEETLRELADPRQRS